MAVGRAEGSNGQAAEIVRLCEGYSIASQFASFIVLENDAEYKRWKIARNNATRVERDRQAQTAVREELEKLRRETAQKLGPKSDAQSSRKSEAQPATAKPVTDGLAKRRRPATRNRRGRLRRRSR